MGYSYGTYHFYGVHVPREKYVTDSQQRETGFIDGVIKILNNPRHALGHVKAGEYDQEELFLCTVPNGDDIEAELGTFKATRPDTRAAEVAEWDQLLANLIGVIGYEGLDEPGWITVPYCA